MVGGPAIFVLVARRGSSRPCLKSHSSVLHQPHIFDIFQCFIIDEPHFVSVKYIIVYVAPPFWENFRNSLKGKCAFEIDPFG